MNDLAGRDRCSVWLAWENVPKEGIAGHLSASAHLNRISDFCTLRTTTPETSVILDDSLEQFALPFAREERIFLVKMLFATRQNLQTNSKDALGSKVKTPHNGKPPEKCDHVKSRASGCSDPETFPMQEFRDACKEIFEEAGQI
ncbi:hypothetical protein [Thalassoglobus sp.]|uniref:hypothetical protein n=1 Tax=Thalassoglobus sp. TaxID=2795869 RepID=UPI003AA94F51